MIMMRILPAATDPEECLPDLISIGQIKAVVRLPGGMESGKSSVIIEIEVNGCKYHAETSLALFLAAAHAFEEKEKQSAKQSPTSH